MNSFLCKLHPDLLPLVCWPNSEENSTYKETRDQLKSTLALGSTSNKYRKLIQSPKFIDAMISRVGSKLLLPESFIMEFGEDTKNLMPQQYRLLTNWIRNEPLQKNEGFKGYESGDLYGTSENVEFISFSDNQIFRTPLKEGKPPTLLIIPTKERISSPEKGNGFAAFSKKFIAVSPPGRNQVFLFSSLNNEYLRKFSVEGKILQLQICGRFLFVRAVCLKDREKLFVFDIHAKKAKAAKFSIPGKIPLSSPLCFGKTHVVGVKEVKGKYQFFAAKREALTHPVLKNARPFLITNKVSFSSCPQIFSEDNYFIVITHKKNCFNVEKIHFQDTHCQIDTLGENIQLFDDGKLSSLFYQWGRLYCASYKGQFGRYHLSSYDLETKKKDTLLDSVANEIFHPVKSRFVSSANSVNFVAGSIQPTLYNPHIDSDLITVVTSFTYGPQANNELKANQDRSSNTPRKRARILKG